MPTPKKITDKWFSLYIRLRDAIEFHKETGRQADISFGQCCTCGKIGQWKYMDCGHFISKASSGSSGIRWDERNAHLQCKICNAFNQGKPHEYEQYMLAKYGQQVIDELRIKDKVNMYRREQIEGLGLYYKSEYQRLCKENGLKK